MNPIRRKPQKPPKYQVLDPLDRKGYFKALLPYPLYVTGDAQIIRGYLRPNSKLTISQWKNRMGTNFVPAFTSLGRLQRSIKLPCTVISVHAKDLFRVLRPAQIIVNKGFADEIAFSPQERWKIAPQGFWSSQNKPDLEAMPLQRFMLLPLELQEDLCRFFRSVKGIRNAYIQNIVPAKDERRMQLLLAIDYRGDAERIRKIIYDIVAQSSGDYENIELTVNVGDYKPLPEELYQLFYHRKGSWDLL